MENNYIEKCHSQLLALLKFVDALCEKNNIKYSLSSGTMIGAVREKGFIEWDDDADIIFKRCEYNKFLDAINKENLPDYVGVYRPEEKEVFLDFNIRVYYASEKLREGDNFDNMYNGLYAYSHIDVFILDELPANKLLNRLFVLNHQIIFGLAMAKREDIHYRKYSPFIKLSVMFLSFVGRFFSIKKVCELHEKVCTKYLGKNKEYLYGTSWEPTYPKFQYRKELFDEYIKVPFEDTYLMIVKNYDEILRYDYGDDYMTPKKTHEHDENYVINL